MVSVDRTRQFVQLLTQCERRLFGYILSMVASFSDADDIAQETKIRLWEQFDEYDPDRDFLAWACSIAHYQVMTHRKRVGREKMHFSQGFVDAVADEVRQQSDTLARHEDALTYCVRKLGKDACRLLKMIYEEGLSVKEVALRQGRKLAATYQAVWRLRKSLHLCIRRRLAEGDAP
jgi:RNA polymerase sigma-70 factor (ECF subfamily)